MSPLLEMRGAADFAVITIWLTQHNRKQMTKPISKKPHSPFDVSARRYN